MVGLIVIAAFPVNHVPDRPTILEFVSHPLTPQGSPPAVASGSSGGSGSRSRLANSSIRSSSSGAGQEAELPASAYTAETLLFCGVSTAIALSVTDLGKRAAQLPTVAGTL